MVEKRIELTTYLARPIEHYDPIRTKEIGEEFVTKLRSPKLLIYDPVFQEKSKVGQLSKDQVLYIKNLKRAGKWHIVYEEMWKIWFGEISPNSDILDVLKALRNKKHIEGNYQHLMISWGDGEAVARSDFLIVYLPLAAKSIGVILECVIAFLLRIPIYLVVPDGTKVDTNTTLLWMNQVSNNLSLRSNEYHPNVFYTIDECVEKVKKDYLL